MGRGGDGEYISLDLSPCPRVRSVSVSCCTRVIGDKLKLYAICQSAYVACLFLKATKYGKLILVFSGDRLQQFVTMSLTNCCFL